MIFSEEERRQWPPVKKDYKVGDRVKVIDLMNLEGKGAVMRSYLGLVGTVTDTSDKPMPGAHLIYVCFGEENPDCCFHPEELRPAFPDEISARIPTNADLTMLFVKAALIGVFRAGK